MSAPQVNTAPRGRKTVGKQPKAPQVDFPIHGWNNAGTSAGATGGILKLTPAECRRNHRRYTPMPSGINISAPPEVNVPYSWGGILQAHPQEPPEVYSNYSRRV